VVSLARQSQAQAWLAFFFHFTTVPSPATWYRLTLLHLLGGKMLSIFPGLRHTTGKLFRPDARGTLEGWYDRVAAEST